MTMNVIVQTATGTVLWAITLPLFAGNVAPPLPSAAAVLQRVVAQARMEEANDRAFAQNYSFTRTKVTEYRNAEGNLKQREEKQSLNDPSPSAGSADPQRVAA